MKGLTAQMWTDGGSRSNPGPAAIGVIIKDSDGRILWQTSRYLGSPISNNQAEYQALVVGLTEARRLSVAEIKAYLDSQLVVEQVCGRYKVKDAGLQQWWRQARDLLDQFDHWQVVYVPRAENAAADRLVNQALDQAEQMQYKQNEL